MGRNRMWLVISLLVVVAMAMVACGGAAEIPPTPVPPTIATSAVPTITPTATPAIVNCDQSMIAFISDRDGNHEIYVINADGSNPTNLTNNSANDGNPIWSPDGSKIVFLSDPTGNIDDIVYVMNADGTGVKYLTDQNASLPERNRLEQEYFAAWSPDRSKVAYWFDQFDGNFEIYVMKKDELNSPPTELNNMTKNSASDEAPAWSPDGSKIVFSSDRDGNYEVYVMNADGSNPTNLTNNSADDEDPTWSPDGNKIAFITYRDGKGEVYVMNADGSNPTNLTNNKYIEMQAAWSPVCQ